MEEQQSTDKIERLEKKAQKAHERLDAAREKLPKNKVLKKERVFDEEKGKAKTCLHFEEEVKKPQSKLQFGADKTVRKAGDTLVYAVHGKIGEVEQENSAVEAAHKSELVVEGAARHYSHHQKHSENKPYEKVSKLEHEAQVADTKLHYEKTKQEHPEIKKQRINMNSTAKNSRSRRNTLRHEKPVLRLHPTPPRIPARNSVRRQQIRLRSLLPTTRRFSSGSDLVCSLSFCLPPVSVHARQCSPLPEIRSSVLLI